MGLLFAWLGSKRPEVSEEANTESGEQESPPDVDLWLRQEFGLVPLEAAVCENRCGCVSLVAKTGWGDRYVWRHNPDWYYKITLI